ncbi:hypothetical protein QF000_000800 [Paraburkholderia atlantica]|uniref:Uncharacterized protein n=2 Tax=Paraburkholderia TaxID=1822464 RepID=A0A7W8LFG4_9BURK|nr:hypothetical protein [Paraburkholderia youngii]MBB5421503.1 hypothetical protein [Paraburkholderia atlantica]MBB5429442.1 hypothetical protein [Paraburkholderia atlantica]
MHPSDDKIATGMFIVSESDASPSTYLAIDVQFAELM